jgi:predicted nucleotidyltransferase
LLIENEIEKNAGDTVVETIHRVSGADHLLTHDEIRDAIRQVADQYALTKAAYFGSYADGRATPASDLDLLVEFVAEDVDILTICGLGIDLEEILRIPVDVIHAPIPKDSILEINNTVLAYENNP